MSSQLGFDLRIGYFSFSVISVGGIGHFVEAGSSRGYIKEASRLLVLPGFGL